MQNTTETAPNEFELVAPEVVQHMLSGFSKIEDPRREQGKRHNLSEMVFMALCAVLSGADGWIAVEHFCHHQSRWLQKHLKLEHGVPTHDTFERVFAMLAPKALEQTLLSWLQHAGFVHRDKVIAIDGKTLRGSLCKASEQTALHLLHAFGTESGIVLGQQAVDSKENEIVAIPRLLAQLCDLKGRTVTLDAMGTQKSVAQDIHKRKGQYILALKDNHPLVHKHVRQHFEFAERMNFDRTRNGKKFVHKQAHDTNGEHGRIEERRVDVLDATGDWFHEQHPGWSSVQSVIRVTSKRTLGDRCSTEQRFYLSSHSAAGAENLAGIIRSHWAIENNLHWCLDTAFHEDRCKTRKDHGLQNLAMFRRTCLALLRSDKKTKAGLQAKRQMAAWNQEYRAAILHLF